MSEETKAPEAKPEPAKRGSVMATVTFKNGNVITVKREVAAVYAAKLKAHNDGRLAICNVESVKGA